MVTVVRNPITSKHAQAFRGGYADLDTVTKARLDNKSCCAGAVTWGIDRLPPRMRPNNDLTHTKPTGNNEKRHIGGRERHTMEIIEHLRTQGNGATVGIFAIPDLAFLTHIGVMVRNLPAGLTMSIDFRSTAKTRVFVNGSKQVVTASGAICDPIRDHIESGMGATDMLSFVANAAGVITTSTVVALKPDFHGAFFPNADELVLTFTGAASVFEKLSPLDFDFTIGINYDTVIRAEH